MIQAVIFDMDGLLIDTEPEWQVLERDFVRQKTGIVLTPDMQKQTLGLRTIEMIRHWYAFKPWSKPDFSGDEKELDQKMKAYYTKDAVLMKGVREILSFFRNKKIRIALASSSPFFLIHTFLDHFGLDSFFDICHSAEEEEYGKPHPAVYLTTARLLGTEPSCILAFEDSCNGLISAKKAGMKTVFIPDKRHFNPECLSFSDLMLESLLDFGDKEFESLSIRDNLPQYTIQT